MKKAIRATAWAFSILGAAACAPEGPPPATPTTTAATSASAAATFEQQAAAGHDLYVAHCASCHGAGGEGKDGPRLVGVAQGALPLSPPPTAKFRKTPFRTAADVAAFVVKSMPPDAPGSLTEAEYWSVLAFDLKANGVDLGASHLDASSAPSVVLHP